jgi:hypothetical protein
MPMHQASQPGERDKEWRRGINAFTSACGPPVWISTNLALIVLDKLCVWDVPQPSGNPMGFPPLFAGILHIQAIFRLSSGPVLAVNICRKNNILSLVILKFMRQLNECNIKVI